MKKYTLIFIKVAKTVNWNLEFLVWKQLHEKKVNNYTAQYIILKKQ